MFRYNLKLALRNLVKNKTHTIINIFGLSTGVACFILISLFIYFEWNYDNFNKDDDRIYQIYRQDNIPGGISKKNASTPELLTITLDNEYSYLGTVIGVNPYLYEGNSATINGEKHYGLKGALVGSDFFKVFNFPLISGNSGTCLEGPNDVVLSRKAAERYFVDRDPIGKTFTFNKRDFIVRGIAMDLPVNSIFKYDVFFSSRLHSIIDNPDDITWWSCNTYNFIKLAPEVKTDELNTVFKEIIAKHFPEWFKNRMEFFVQPLREVHLNTEVSGQIYPTLDKTYLNILLVIAVSILFIACINYINLSTSQAGRRAKETGVKKVAGASRKQLILQFFSESVSVSILSVFIALILAELFRPWFNQLANRDIEIHFYSLPLFLIILTLGIVIGLISGIYPALVLSSFRPITAFKSEFPGVKGKSYLRRTLVIIQMTVTIILISTELLILKQIHFMQTAKLGYNLDNILSLPLWSLEPDQHRRYEEAQKYLQQVNPYNIQYGFGEGSITENIPGYYIQNRFVIPNPVTGGELGVITFSVDEAFFKVFDVPILEGREFRQQDEGTQPKKIIINEKALKELEQESVIGKTFEIEGASFEIIGIIPDLHVESLRNPVVPLMLVCGEEFNFPEFISIRLDPEKMKASIEFLQQSWKNLFPDKPFDFFFPKDEYLKHYTEEKRMAKILAVFVFLTISISALGIFGLVLFNSQTRTKEIGIRKTFGASVASVIGLLSKELILWIIISFSIAILPSWYAMRQWLENFAFKTSISWWVFLLTLGIVFTIALFTAGWHTYKAARRNPVEVLRYE